MNEKYVSVSSAIKKRLSRCYCFSTKQLISKTKNSHTGAIGIVANLGFSGFVSVKSAIKKDCYNVTAISQKTHLGIEDSRTAQFRIVNPEPTDYVTVNTAIKKISQ